MKKKLQKKNKKSPMSKKAKRIRLIAASATVSAVLAVSPYMASASGASAAVASAVGDSNKNGTDKTDEASSHTESDSEASVRKILESMLSDAGTVSDMTTKYGYTEGASSLSESDAKLGDIVCADGTYYIVADYTDTDGTEHKELWKEDGNGSFTAGTVSFGTFEHVYHVTAKEPELTLPAGLTGTDGQKLSEVTLPDGYSWKDPDKELEAGEHTYDAVYTPDNTILYTSKNVSLTVTASQKVHELTLPKSSYSISYEPGLKAGSITLPDNWAFEDPDAEITLGTNTYTAVFTGDKSLKWSASTDNVTVKITATKKHVSFDPISVSVKQGAELTDSALPKTDGGHFTWKTSGQKADTAGTFTYYAIFIPDDLDRYEVTDNIPVTVTVKAPKNLTRPESSYSVVYEPNTKISSIALPDSWVFDNPDAVIKLGTHSYRVSFTGDKTDNWTGSTDSFDVSVTASKRTIDIDPITITVDADTKLTDSLLPKRKDGTLKWKKSGESSGFSQSVHYAVFNPSDTERYNKTDNIPVTVKITVDKTKDNDSKSDTKTDTNTDSKTDTKTDTKDSTSKSDDASKADRIDTSQTGKSDRADTSGTADKSDASKTDDKGSKGTDSRNTDSSKTSGVTSRNEKNAEDTVDRENYPAPKKNTSNASSSGTSATSSVTKPHITLRNISASQVVPVAPSSTGSSSSSSLNDVSATPTTSSSPAKDVTATPATGSKSKSSNKKKTDSSSTDVYTPDPASDVKVKTDTKDKDFDSASGVDGDSKTSSGKKTATKTASRMPAALIAVGVAVVAAAAGVFLFIRKRKTASDEGYSLSDEDISGLSTKDDDDDSRFSGF